MQERINTLVPAAILQKNKPREVLYGSPPISNIYVALALEHGF